MRLSPLVLNILAGIVAGGLLGYSLAMWRHPVRRPPVAALTPEEWAIVDWAQLHAPHTLIARVTAPYPVALDVLKSIPEARSTLRVEPTHRARLAYAERSPNQR